MKSETSSKPPFEVLRSYLNEHFECTLAGRKRITFPVKLRAVTVTCQAAISEDDRTLNFRALYPVVPPAGKRASTAVLVACANNYVRYGSLRFDWDAMETFFEATHFIGTAQTLPEETLFHISWCCLSIADRFFPALMGHWHGDMLPHEAALCADLDEPDDRLEEGMTHDRKNWQPTKPNNK